MKKGVINILLTLASFALTLGLLEIGFRLFTPVFEERPLYNVSSQKTDFTPNTRAQYRSSEFLFSIQTNRFGRRDVQWTEDVIHDPDNILMIGDSFVLGYGVDAFLTIPDLLEKEYGDRGVTKEVFNFGMPGDIAFPEYKMLLEEALELGIEAKTVILGIFIGNDFQYAPVAKTFEQKTITTRSRFDWRKSRLYHFVRQRVSASPLLTALALKTGSTLGLEVYDSPSSRIFRKDESRYPFEMITENLNTLLKIKEYCLENKRSLYVVLFPNKLQVENADLFDKYYDFKKPNRLIRHFCDKHNISCLDMHDVLRQEYRINHNGLYYSRDRHFNERGNKMAAKIIFDNINTLVHKG